MKFYKISILLLLPFVACSETQEVERVETKYELLSDDVFTRMPGNLLLADDYLVWTDPFTTDYFVHVHQVSDGKKEYMYWWMWPICGTSWLWQMW